MRTRYHLVSKSSLLSGFLLSDVNDLCMIFLVCNMYKYWHLFFFSVILTDLSVRVDKVKEENLKLKSENQVLGQYIENLMSASSVFQSTSPKNKKK